MGCCGTLGPGLRNNALSECVLVLALYLNALFDPEVTAHGLPVLGTGDVKEPLVNTALHGSIKHLKKLCSDQWLRTAQP